MQTTGTDRIYYGNGYHGLTLVPDAYARKLWKTFWLLHHARTWQDVYDHATPEILAEFLAYYVDNPEELVRRLFLRTLNNGRPSFDEVDPEQLNLPAPDEPFNGNWLYDPGIYPVTAESYMLDWLPADLQASCGQEEFDLYGARWLRIFPEKEEFLLEELARRGYYLQPHQGIIEVVDDLTEPASPDFPVPEDTDFHSPTSPR